MSNLRTGIFGEYYGSYYNESKALTQTQMEKNALYIYSSLLAKGWTAEAIAGLLGNMQHESSINPGRWQGNNVGATSSGYSLVQWTPATKYINWCTNQGLSDPSEMDNALARILWEVENKAQYASTSGYPESFREFSESTKSPYYLACAFAWNYERSAVVIWGAGSKDAAANLTEAEKEANREALRKRRGGAAESWYTFLTGQEPIPPDNPGGGGSGYWTNKKKGYKFVIFGRRRFLT